MPFDTSTLERLDRLVDSACTDPTSDIPGTTVVVVGKDGQELFAKAAGKRGVASPGEPMTLDSVYYIASCTKLLTGIAVMQVVEQGTLKLDDADQIETLCPELKDLKVLRPDGSLEEKKVGITLRMLLTHTAGFGYAFFNERLRDWCAAAGVRALPGTLEDVTLPLLFQPGEGWEYGVGVDWAGVALERVTGLSLNDYMHKHIFAPLGIQDMSMIPHHGMRSRLAEMHARGEDGVLRARDHLLLAPLTIDPDEVSQKRQIFNAGGSGLFAKPQEYCKILAVLLNDGTCPRTGNKILDKATVDEMFRNQVPDFPEFGRQGIPAAIPDLTHPLPDLYPVEGKPPQGWGLTFMQSCGGPTGRSKGTGHWAGLANTWWWCDREKGVAGMVCTQILPFADPKVLGLWFQVETEVYRGLEAGK
ncbi:Beta-lactamase-like protein [Apiospora arundinis]|uniref:Beta-lactamase-like protein n=1 Tax=Apiospora arundinis TaxID=335852 RepID=A0ABR2HY15_9PEZI